MKKVLLLAFASLCLLSLRSSAQIVKGSVLLGGGISGGSSKSEANSQETKSSSFSFSPSIGVAIKDNSVVGIRLSYYHSKTKQTDITYPLLTKSDGFSGGVFYRRYMSLSKKFYLFGEGAAYYLHSKYTNEYPTNKSGQTINSLGLNFYPGVAYAVNRRIHLEVGLNSLLDINYGRGEIENTSGGVTTTSKTSGFNVSTNVSTSAPLIVGFRFVLGK